MSEEQDTTSTASPLRQGDGIVVTPIEHTVAWKMKRRFWRMMSKILPIWVICEMSDLEFLTVRQYWKRKYLVLRRYLFGLECWIWDYIYAEQAEQDTCPEPAQVGSSRPMPVPRRAGITPLPRMLLPRSSPCPLHRLRPHMRRWLTHSSG